MRNLATCFIVMAALAAISATSAEAEQATIPGTEQDVVLITEGLPWTFVVSGIDEVSDEAALPGATVEMVKQRLRSEEAIRKTGSIELFLEPYLSTWQLDNVDQARTAFEAMRRRADPDTGLSYAWDAVLLVGDRLYRLHAGCTLAKEHFDVLVANLENAVALKSDPPPMLRCRCGGGCALRE